jgi:threonine dehydratase
MLTLEAPSLADVRAARDRIAGIVTRTPLLPLPVPEFPGRIWLKLENLQPIGAFKIRGAANAMLSLPPERLAKGVYTASAGNMAQGVAWCARELGVPCRVIVPDNAPATKLAAIERLGGETVRVPYERWWQCMVEHGFEGEKGTFIHSVSDPAVIAGNGTIGLEIIEDLSHVDAVLVPYGGGGLSCGIAAAISTLRPGLRVFACEVEVAAPLSAALAAGKPVPIEHSTSFVDGIGARGLLPEMWPLASRLLAGAIVVSLEQIASAIRLMVERRRVVAEGAGAAPVAAALTGKAGGGDLVCVVSGGNLDTAKLQTILDGRVP